MIEVDATLFTLLVEGFALAWVILLISFTLSARRNGRDRKALRALVSNINEEAGARLDRTRALLDDGDSATALSNCERSVCQAFIGVYNKRSAASVDTVYAALKMLVDGYQRQLEERPQAGSAEPPLCEATEAPKDAVISQLKSEHEQTTRELQITKRTMEKMLLEYNSMFAGGQEAETAVEIEAEEILQMLDPERSQDAGDRAGDGHEPVDQELDIEARVEST